MRRHDRTVPQVGRQQGQLSLNIGAGSVPAVRRQLVFRIDDNYFSRSTTITFLTLSRRTAPAVWRKGEARPRSWFSSFRDKRNRGGGKVGNLLLVFHFSIRLHRRSCGNVGISPAVGEISKGLVERGGSLLLAFHAFHRPAISTALPCPFFVAASTVVLIRSQPGCPPVASAWHAPPDSSECSAR